MMTLFLLLSLSYASTMVCYDTAFSPMETEILCEDIKEEVKKDSTVDSLDILLTMKFCFLVSPLVSIRIEQIDNYYTLYEDPLFKPPRLS